MTQIMKKTDDFYQYAKNTDRKVVLYGIGVMRNI